MPSAGATKRVARSRKSAAKDSDAVEDQLARYRAMRRFDVTAEPRGGSRRTAKKSAAENTRQLPFVIQKHAATRLHYDFRLGWRGVLKSWAVTKGPSYDPRDKRLAVQVEDHPIEYGGFEGIIPKGQYGGGTVLLWDEGAWSPHGDVDEGLAQGELKFTLYGHKLHGDWVLVRMGGKAARQGKPNWLLIKERDVFARDAGDPCVTVAEPDSVLTGRDLEAIAKNQDHVWDVRKGPEQRKRSRVHSTPSAGRRAASIPAPSPLSSRRSTQSRKKSVATIDLRDAPKESLPQFVPPQLTLQVEEAPEGATWMHELKLDGYRIQARIDRSKKHATPRATLRTRSGLDWTDRMTGIAGALEKLPVASALLDGEVVVFDEHGVSNFALLQAAFQNGSKRPQTYVVFDLLHLNGHNVRGLSLVRRKKILEELLATLDAPETVRFSEHLTGSGQKIFQKACELGAEGIVSKKISAPYTSGRSGAWVKIKCVHKQEFVIGGFTPPSKSGVGIGALLLGYYRDGELVYAGRTGTGFTQKMRKDLRRMLDSARQPQSPFVALPASAAHQAQWVEPRFVCEVRFATWTADNLVRQASFQGLREDKPAREVEREAPVDARLAQRKPAPTPGKKLAARKKKIGNSSAFHSRDAAPAQRKNLARDAAFPIVLTHPDRIVDSESKLTKRELAEYFWAVREHILPYISGRPLSVVRCPRGSTHPCFYQKHVTGTLPRGVDGVAVRERRSGALETYLTVSTPLGLAGLAQMGVLELHPWGSSNGDIEKPDMLVFDLDPDVEISWATLAESAREIRVRLQQCRLESFVKTTGGKGLHVVAPIQPEHDWSVVKGFALAFARRMESENKQLYVTNMTRAARKGKIYIDYLRNERGATSIAPYSPRARQGAPVAVPLDWKELDERRVPRFPVADFAQWKKRLRRDPWREIGSTHQSLRADVQARFASRALSQMVYQK